MFPLLLAALATLLLSPLVFFTLLFPPLFSGSPLGLPSLGLFSRLDLALELSLLLFDRPQFSTNTLPLSPACGSLCGVLLIRFRTADSFFLGCLVADLDTAQLADVSFNGAAVDQSADDFLCFLIDTTAVEGAVNKGCSLTALQCEKLCWVALDFPLGDLEDGFGDLGFVVLDAC